MFLHGKGPHLAAESQFEHAKRLVNLGYDVLAIDYRGFGTSTDVAPTEAGIEEDTRAVMAWVASRAGGADRVFLYGHSLGAAAAIQRAAIDPPLMSTDLPCPWREAPTGASGTPGLRL